MVVEMFFCFPVDAILDETVLLLLPEVEREIQRRRKLLMEFAKSRCDSKAIYQKQDRISG